MANPRDVPEQGASWRILESEDRGVECWRQLQVGNYCTCQLHGGSWLANVYWYAPMQFKLD